MNAVTHLQKMRIRAHAANGHLPRGGRWYLEDEVEIERRDEPRGPGEFLIEVIAKDGPEQASTLVALRVTP